MSKVVIIKHYHTLCPMGSTGQVGRAQGRVDRAPEQGSGHPTPESKTHKGTPCGDGIGIQIPSLYISPSGVEGKFFS